MRGGTFDQALDVTQDNIDAVQSTRPSYNYIIYRITKQVSISVVSVSIYMSSSLRMHILYGFLIYNFSLFHCRTEQLV